ncbi:hypothetical protein FLP10_03330 [Agromyces intestinalis]|uniref:Glycosyltransferase n=1 Tax=Agromyces intestinalis TaxID=2592652 RepID=A0A5C1YC33_9MICO|nr:hypothetical protein [Agromyces intestinalis]QEO13556.1 hypothetical protein FLP10_03330 [Agromyces intestinalis]
MSGVLTSMRRAAGRFILSLPEPIAVRIVPKTFGFRASEVPKPVLATPTPVRLLVAPANYAGQGHAWARAAERLDGVGGVSLTITRPGTPDFPADAIVSETVAVRSKRWIDGQRRAVRGFTHVLIEAERPLLGGAFGGDVRAEVAELESAGVRVAFVSHGSDLRLPSRHAEHERWSPFLEPDWDLAPVLEQTALANAAVLDDAGAPVFVSTPDLLLDRPDATWLPVVIDLERWATTAPVLERETPVVRHSPTNPVIKGTALIEPVLRELAAEGRIDLRLESGIPPAKMPAAIGDADVVLEQFRIGTYSVTAVEAMAAGRLVIAHVSDQVRRAVLDQTGLELPILEADPDTLGTVLRDVLADRERFRELAARGPAFAAAVHDGARSARVLAPFLGADRDIRPLEPR